MVERVQPQLLLISTAHRSSTRLMVGRRQAALAELESGEGDLLVEWSAPEGTGLDEVAGWQQASPSWTPARHHLIERQLAMMRAGELVDDPDEPDPEQFFRAQWLNQWPRRVAGTGGDTEVLLPDGVWSGLYCEGVTSSGPIWVAVEDDVGLGKAVAAVGRLPDGRLEVDGWRRSDWESAMADVTSLAKVRQIRSLQVGASLLERVPTGLGTSARPAGTKETRFGLSMLRDLVGAGALVHDACPDLDEALAVARVREAATGLVLAQVGPTHLVRAAVWAISAAAKPAKVPAVH